MFLVPGQCISHVLCYCLSGSTSSRDNPQRMLSSWICWILLLGAPVHPQLNGVTAFYKAASGRGVYPHGPSCLSSNLPSSHIATCPVPCGSGPKRKTNRYHWPRLKIKVSLPFRRRSCSPFVGLGSLPRFASVRFIRTILMGHLSRPTHRGLLAKRVEVEWAHNIATPGNADPPARNLVPITVQFKGKAEKALRSIAKNEPMTTCFVQTVIIMPGDVNFYLTFLAFSW